MRVLQWLSQLWQSSNLMIFSVQKASVAFGRRPRLAAACCAGSFLHLINRIKMNKFGTVKSRKHSHTYVRTHIIKSNYAHYGMAATCKATLIEFYAILLRTFWR